MPLLNGILECLYLVPVLVVEAITADMPGKVKYKPPPGFFLSGRTHTIQKQTSLSIQHRLLVPSVQRRKRKIKGRRYANAPKPMENMPK